MPESDKTDKYLKGRRELQEDLRRTRKEYLLIDGRRTQLKRRMSRLSDEMADIENSWLSQGKEGDTNEPTG